MVINISYLDVGRLDFLGSLTVSPIALMNDLKMLLMDSYLPKFLHAEKDRGNVGYFTPDCQIVINNKHFDADAFKQRMRWIKENLKEVEVELISYICSADGQSFSDAHITTAVGHDNKSKKVVVMQHSTLKNEKIHRFVDVTYMLEGEKVDNYIINAK